MANRSVRMGIDVGGTHTKAVALDNATNEIIGISQVKTTHDDPKGVAAGVVQSFKECLKKNNISPDEVVFIAHSTTQATNALLEGDVAEVGILGMAKGGLEGFLAKRQSHIDDIDLGTGRHIKIHNEFLKFKEATDEAIGKKIGDLANSGAGVIVASAAFSVDNNKFEQAIYDQAKNAGLLVTMASEISKLYGLTRRTRTAAINASILPKMLDTANSTEQSVREAGITVPLMIMRGDGGVMDISEMQQRPVLTMLSGPAASVMGALMYLRASNGIYFEVGGTSTNIGVIKDGRPTVDYTVLGGHPTYVNSLDVRVLGVAGGSMVRASNKEIVDVGPRSAHIAGLPYATYTPEEEIEDPQVEFFAPKPGDPADYVAIRLKSGKRLAITNSCAANALGLVEPQYFSYGSKESARKAIQPLADLLGQSVDDTARQILDKACDKIEPVINALSAKYNIEKEEISLVGVGGGAAALIPFASKRMDIRYKIPQNAEVISSIGVALALVRDVVERVIPSPTEADIASIKKEALELAIKNGAVPDSVEVQVEIDARTSRVKAIALGSTEVQTQDLSLNCSEAEAAALAAESFRCSIPDVVSVTQTDAFFVFGNGASGKIKNTYGIRLVDKKGFIRVQRRQGRAVKCTVAEAAGVVNKMGNEMTMIISDGEVLPDFYLCIHGKLLNYSNMITLEQVLSVMNTEFLNEKGDQEIIIIGACSERR